MNGKVEIVKKDLLGKRLIEHLNNFHERGTILKVIMADETVTLTTDQGDFTYYKRGIAKSDALFLEGDPPRFAIIRE